MRKILKNEYVFSIFSRFISVLISLVQSVLVARYLGAELQGINSYISSLVGIGAILITFGMHQAYPYYRKKFGKEKIYNDYLSLTIMIYIVFALLSFINLLFPIPFELRAAIFLVPLYGYSRVVAYICLVEKPNVRNFWWIITGILELIFITLLIIFTKRNCIWGITILAFCEVVKSIVYTVILRPKIKIHKGLLKFGKELIRYGFFPMLALLMTTLNYKIDILMLKQYSYISNAMIGIYTIGVQMAERVIMIPDTLKGVLVSRLAKGCKDTEVALVCRLSFWASLIMCFVFIILGPAVINILYGSDFKGAYIPLVICAFGTISISYFKLIAQYNIVNKKQILNVYMLSAAIMADVIFNLIFIPIWQINGAALATGLGNLVCGLVFVSWYIKETKTPVKLMIIPQKSDFEAIKKLLQKKEEKQDNS